MSVCAGTSESVAVLVRTSALGRTSVTIRVSGKTGAWFTEATVSSSRMVTVAVAGAPSVAAPAGLDSVTVNVLLPSATALSMTATVRVCGVASPAAQASVPLVAVKSAGELAVPLAVAKLTPTVPFVPFTRTTVSVMLPADSLTE